MRRASDELPGLSTSAHQHQMLLVRFSCFSSRACRTDAKTLGRAGRGNLAMIQADFGQSARQVTCNIRDGEPTKQSSATHTTIAKRRLPASRCAGVHRNSWLQSIRLCHVRTCTSLGQSPRCLCIITGARADTSQTWSQTCS